METADAPGPGLHARSWPEAARLKLCRAPRRRDRSRHAFPARRRSALGVARLGGIEVERRTGARRLLRSGLRLGEHRPGVQIGPVLDELRLDQSPRHRGRPQPRVDRRRLRLAAIELQEIKISCNYTANRSVDPFKAQIFLTFKVEKAKIRVKSDIIRF